MSEVVPFPRAEPLFWVCGCGCQSFRLRSDGAIECAACEKVSDGGDWRAPMDPPPADAEVAKMTQANFEITSLGPHALARMLRSGADNAGEFSAAILIREDSSMRIWGVEFDTRQRRDWIRRKMKEATKMLLRP